MTQVVSYESDPALNIPHLYILFLGSKFRIKNLIFKECMENFEHRPYISK